MLNKKIFAFDLDGTLLPEDWVIKDVTLKALQRIKDEGHILVINTGRGQGNGTWMNEICSVKFDYIIYNNGSYFDNLKTKETSFAGEIDKDIIHDVINLGKDYQAVFLLHTNKGMHRYIYFSEENKPEWAITGEWARVLSNKQYDVTLDQLNEKIANEKVIQLTFRASEEDILDIRPKVTKILGDKLTPHNAGGIYLDITMNGVDKFQGLEKIRLLEKVNPDDVYVFGDSGNDLAMIQGYKNSYCMENGSQNVKEAAKEVIGHHNTDAIGIKINEILDIKK